MELFKKKIKNNEKVLADVVRFFKKLNYRGKDGYYKIGILLDFVGRTKNNKKLLEICLGICYIMSRRKWEGKDMSPRTGRPIVGTEPKDKQIALRATKTTVQKFNECAELTGKTKTDLLEEMVDELHDRLTRK